MRFSKSRFRRQATRILTVWFLVGLQAGMVWLGEFHRHGEELVGMGGATSVAADAGQPANAHLSPRCIACQVRQERAASLDIVHVTAPVTSVRGLITFLRLHFVAELPLTADSPRAPPVS